MQSLRDAGRRERVGGRSPITHTVALKGNLLIIRGTGDDSIHYQGTEKLLNELIAKSKRFAVMQYPNCDHLINSDKGISRHFCGLMTDYLHE